MSRMKKFKESFNEVKRQKNEYTPEQLWPGMHGKGLLILFILIHFSRSWQASWRDIYYIKLFINTQCIRYAEGDSLVNMEPCV